MNDEFNRNKTGDFIFNCDICGEKCYASQATKLDVYTGRGGCIVCPSCKDRIDFGLVPYKVPAEKPVPFVRDAMQANNPTAISTGNIPSWPYELFPPWVDPDTVYTDVNPWNQLVFLTWDQWNTNVWEQ